MTNIDSIPVDLRPLYSRAQALTALIDKCKQAQLGEEPQMRKELQKIEKLAIQQLQEIHRKVESHKV